MLVDVTACSEEMKWAAGPAVVGAIATPMAIFHHHRHSSFVEFLRKETEIAEFTATIQFDSVESKIDRCLNITNVVINAVENFGVATDWCPP
jgi:hypothetical protein